MTVVTGSLTHMKLILNDLDWKTTAVIQFSFLGLLIPTLYLPPANAMTCIIPIVQNFTVLCVFSLIIDHTALETNVIPPGGSDSCAGKGSRQVKGPTLMLKQFHALLVKRFHHAVRSQKDFVAQVQRCSDGGLMAYSWCNYLMVQNFLN